MRIEAWKLSLDRILGNFFKDITKKDGQESESDAFQFSFLRHKGASFNIIEDRAFETS